jgi:murein DD-endopeptidase MepM/ murein hydrolase activator NlpD
VNKLWVLLFVFLFAGCPTTPVTSRQDWHWQLPVPAVAPDRDRSISTIVWAGGTVSQLTPELAVQGLAGPLAELRLVGLDGNTLGVWRAADLAADGRPNNLPTVQGSAVRLVVSTPAGQDWPRVNLMSLSVVEQTTAPDAGALRLAAGDTVAAWFPNPDRALFLRVPAGSQAVDLVAIGEAELRIADPLSDGPVLDPALAWGRLVPDRPGDGSRPPGGWTRVAERDVIASPGLWLTWAALADAPQPTVARLMAAAVDPGAKLAFPARDRGAFFAHWFGVDREGDEPSTCPFSGLDPRALSCTDLLNKLRCTNHAGVSGLDNGVTPHLPVVCYDTHRGSDFGLRGAIFGQAIGVDVTAAQDGVVVFADDGHPDDCFYSPIAGDIRCRDIGSGKPIWDELKTTAETPANRVAVLQRDGHIAWYYHLRRGTVAVVPGEPVRCGDKLGQVGSSGDSAGPHLHYELRAMRDRDATLPSLEYFGHLHRTDTVDPFPDHWRQWSDGEVPSNACP